MLAYQAATKSIPPWPPSPAAIPLHWRHRLLALQTANHRDGVPTGYDAYTHAALYPDTIALAAPALNPRWPRTIKQDPLANSPEPSRSHQP
jgi:hypothetical protein